MRRSLLFGLVCFTQFLGLSYLTAEEAPGLQPRKYFLLSLPKSGTHLICKLLTKMTSDPLFYLGTFCESFHLDEAMFPPHRHATPQVMQSLFSRECEICLYSHFNFSGLFEYFAFWHPEYAKILMIRDLRDICVSTTYFVDDYLTCVLGPTATFDDKLLYVILGGDYPFKDCVFNIEKEGQEALKWMKNPSVLVCKFENLCGEKGEGSNDLQRQEIKKIANILDMPWSEQKIDEIAQQIWGGSTTFRDGRIGSWRKHFKKNHTIAFKKLLGQLLIEMGYEKDMDW